MPKPKTPTLDPEVQPQEQEQVIEQPASPAEAEVVEQRGDEIPELPEEVTFQQLREHPRFKGDWENLTAAQQEERNEAYRKGQEAASKEFDANKKKWGAEQQALATYDHWEAKRNSDDPYETQEFAKAIASPEVEAAYQMGKKLRQGPSTQEVAERAIYGAMDSVYQPLKKHPLLKDMSEEEHQALVTSPDKNDPQPFTTLVNKYCELVIERGIAAGRTKDNAKSLQEAREEGRREAYDEAGLEYPGDPIEGHKPERQPTKAEVGKMSVDELRKLDREGKLDKILAAHK